MDVLFTAAFLIGVFVTVISFLVGGLFDIVGLDGIDFDFGGIDISIPLSPTVYLAFLTVFGACGKILMLVSSLDMWLIVLISIGAGLFASVLLYQGIIKPLKRAQNTSAPDENELVGLQAMVNEVILPNKFGEIRYSINGNSFTSPAKCVNPEEKFLKDEVVYITSIDEHVFYVSKEKKM